MNHVVAGVDLDPISQLDRQALLFELLDRAVGPISMGEETTNLLPLQVIVVPPQKTVPIQVVTQLPFKPRRLVLLEPSVEREVVEVVSTKGFWGTNTKREVRKVIETVPRNAWTIESVRVGSTTQFSGRGSLNGELFAPGGRDLPEFEIATCQPGIMISFLVRHDLLEPTPLAAVIYGDLVERNSALHAA